MALKARRGRQQVRGTGRGLSIATRLAQLSGRDRAGCGAYTGRPPAGRRHPGCACLQQPADNEELTRHPALEGPRAGSGPRSQKVRLRPRRVAAWTDRRTPESPLKARESCARGRGARRWPRSPGSWRTSQVADGGPFVVRCVVPEDRRCGRSRSGDYPRSRLSWSPTTARRLATFPQVVLDGVGVDPLAPCRARTWSVRCHREGPVAGRNPACSP